MRKIIDYDFNEFTNTFQHMLSHEKATVSDLKTLKEELNRFFKDSTCKEVIYTNNYDNMFFGMKIISMIDADEVYEYLLGDEPIRIGKYIVEIDSKLLNPVLDLKPTELMAILLHEVGHLVGNAQPMENARKELNRYLTENNEHLRLSQLIHYKEILAYGLKDYLSKNDSIFYNSNASEIYADDMATAYGFNAELDNAYNKIWRNNMKLYENSEVSKFIVFAWTINVYKNLKIRRIGAIKTLEDSIRVTGSRLERMEMENVIRRIKRIDDSDVISEGALKIKIKEKMRKNRIDNMRMIDSNFYELAMRVKNVEDEEDALYIMRQINNNIAIIDGYIHNKDCDEYEKEEWLGVLKRFQAIRDDLSKSTIYKYKNTGIYVNYPDIVENRY